MKSTVILISAFFLLCALIEVRAYNQMRANHRMASTLYGENTVDGTDAWDRDQQDDDDSGDDDNDDEEEEEEVSEEYDEDEDEENDEEDEEDEDEAEPVKRGYGYGKGGYASKRGGHNGGHGNGKMASYRKGTGAHSKDKHGYGNKMGGYGKDKVAYGRDKYGYGKNRADYGKGEGAYGKGSYGYGNKKGSYGQHGGYNKMGHGYQKKGHGSPSHSSSHGRGSHATKIQNYMRQHWMKVIQPLIEQMTDDEKTMLEAWKKWIHSYDGAVNKSDIMQHADVFFEWAQTKLGYDDELLGALEGWFKTEAMDKDGVVNQMMKMCEMRRRIKEHMAEKESHQRRMAEELRNVKADEATEAAARKMAAMQKILTMAQSAGLVPGNQGKMDVCFNLCM